jgi:hypothetical protein
VTGTTTSQARDAQRVPLSQVDKLRQDAEAAAQVRALTTHPDVVALRVERIRAQVDTLIWVGIALGLAFTMVNVQTFAAAGAALLTLPWLAAWVLDPMVSLVLVAVLRAEQVTARYQVDTGPWVRVTKVFAFAATYVMNTWASWVALNPSGIVLHSVPPVLVYCAAEAGPILRDRLTEAVLRAAHLATASTTATAVTGSAGPSETSAASLPVYADIDAMFTDILTADTAPAPTTPAPTTTTRPTTARGAATRSGKPSRTTKRGKAAVKPPARSMAELRSELDAAIRTGEVDAEPSAEQIRKTLRISPDRARALRDELRTSLTPQALPTSPVDETSHPTHTLTAETTEVTRDAA